MPPVIATYFPYSEFNNQTPSTIEEFRTYLSKYARTRVVYLCSVINALLHTWRGGQMDVDAHAEIVGFAFPPNLAEKLTRGSRDKASPRYVFHRQQLLFVAKEAILNCKEEGLDPLKSPYWGKLGIAFLMANDHLHFGFPEPHSTDERILNTLAEFIPILEYTGWRNLRNKVVRSYLMSTRFLEQLRGTAEFVDIPDRFARIVGMGLDEYYALCFGTLSKYMQMTLARFKENPGSFFLTRSFFPASSVTEERIDRLMTEMSATPDELQERFRSRNAGASDFTHLRDKPLFRHNHNLYALDTGFIAEKLETGPFWRVHNSLDQRGAKEQLHAFWGKVFEVYGNWLLESSVDGHLNVVHVSPIYTSSGEQACDAILKCGTSAALIEFKGSTFTAQAKYGGNPQLLREELATKLIEADDGRKGVTQLASAVSKLFGDGHRDTLRGIDLTGVRTIYPVLVTRDDICGSLLINLFLHRAFRARINPRGVRPRRLTPLFCLSADALEVITGYLREARFTEILHARYQGDPTLRSTFLAVDNPVLNEIGSRTNERLDQAYREFTNGIVHRLFPDEPVQAE